MGLEDQPTDRLETLGGRAALAEPPVIAPGRLLGGRYRLERPLAHGGMAVVWLAVDERLRRPVAVKVLSDGLAADAEYLGRFRREAKLAAGLQHPNLVSIYDFDAGKRPYLVMEYVEGGDLAQRIEAGDAPPAVGVGRELLSALRHIHAAGVLHRDVKPQNVLVDRDDHAHLTDFGIARPRNATAITRTGHVIGTESYIAPEVMAGEPASERSDLFALGVVLAEVARSGEGAGAGFWTLTEELRDPDPERRPGSATAALAMLEREQRGPPPGATTRPFAVTASADGAAPAEPPPTRRPFEPTPADRGGRFGRRGAVATLALCAAAVALIVVLALGQGGDGGSGPGNHAQRAGSSGSKAGDAQPAHDASNGAGATAAGGGGAAPPDGAQADPAAPASDGASLNDQGFELLSAGRPEEAVPILERAVDALRGSGDEATYNYALYNLGVAYLDSGRPQDAIPVLEERMGYDDGQLDEVQARLDQAYAAAGESPPGSEPGNGPKAEKPPKEPKPGNGPPFGEGGD